MKRQAILKARTRKQREALHKLDSFLNKNDRKVARIVTRLWKEQQDAITYKELRQAIERGYITEAQIQEWQSDYVNFFNTHLKPELTNAALAGGNETVDAIFASPGVYAPFETGIENWVTAHGAEFITRVSDEARDAISSMVRYSAKGYMTVDELSRVIRPTIGLTERQYLANAKYYENCKERIKNDLLKKNPAMKEATAEKQAVKRARESAARYAGRQHRQRAYTIAQTELAFAYNKGANEAILIAQAEGLLPKMKAVWITSNDEYTCEVCSALDGVAVNVGDNFNFQNKIGYRQTPPAHPRCRCAVYYEETL